VDPDFSQCEEPQLFAILDGEGTLKAGMTLSANEDQYGIGGQGPRTLTVQTLHYERQLERQVAGAAAVTSAIRIALQYERHLEREVVEQKTVEV
jgi:hypothetical protein